MNEFAHALNNLMIRAQRRNLVYLKWIVGALTLMILFSAMLVIQTNHERRSLVGQLNGLQTEVGNLKQEQSQLLLEQSTLSGYNRLEWMSIQQLQMVFPTTNNMQVVHKQ